jgi:hypothetical protein
MEEIEGFLFLFVLSPPKAAPFDLANERLKLLGLDLLNCVIASEKWVDSDVW